MKYFNKFLINFIHTHPRLRCRVVAITISQHEGPVEIALSYKDLNWFGPSVIRPTRFRTVLILKQTQRIVQLIDTPCNFDRLIRRPGNPQVVQITKGSTQNNFANIISIQYLHNKDNDKAINFNHGRDLTVHHGSIQLRTINKYCIVCRQFSNIANCASAEIITLVQRKYRQKVQETITSVAQVTIASVDVTKQLLQYRGGDGKEFDS